jgi:hypothetical protein
MSKPVTIGTNVVVPLPSRRQPPGPAQHDWLIHFCGRPPDSKMTPSVPTWIAQQAASERLNNILGSGTLYGFPPHGAKQPGDYLLETPPPGAIQPMLCLSESPPQHMDWLLNTRGWQPWGLFFHRQWVYNVGGGPVWYTRKEQHDALRADQLPWAVCLDANSHKSDWLHEREWRIPLPPENGALPLPIGTLAGILIGDPGWKPTDPGNPLWQRIPRLWWEPRSRQLWCWDPITRQFGWWWDPITKQYFSV